jgi:hypothetical protein
MPRKKAKDAADQRQRSLHGVPALVRNFPFSQKRAIVQAETRRLLRKIDVERRAGEQGRDKKRELTEEHARSLTAHRAGERMD